METLSFALAVLVLLATPGPTNTLLAASGAAMGFSTSLKLLPAELLGYFLSINLLMTLALPLTDSLPALGVGLRIIAAAWLVHCAFSLWRHPKQEMTDSKGIRFSKVLTTTLLNPKGLIFAFAIFPSGPLIEHAYWLGVFAGLTMMVGASWIGLGRLLFSGSSSDLRTKIVWRLAATILLVFALVLSGSALQTILA